LDGCHSTLYFVELSKISEIFIILFTPAQDVSQRVRTVKVLSFQSQLFTLICLVARVKQNSDLLGGLSLLDGLKVVIFVVMVEVELFVRTQSPQSQINGVVSVIVGHGYIVSLRDHELAPDPLNAFDP